jgi:hypothetical protein
MNRLAILCATAFAVLPACNTSSEGATGAILFTPRDCGRLGCDFADSIGVGGTINVQIEGNGDVSTAGLSLVSADETVLSATAIADVGGRPTWELVGIGAGVAQLQVLAPDDGLVDFLEVGVQELSALTMENVLGDAVGPVDDAEVDESWQVNADTAVSLQVTPLIGDGAPTMGRYDYQVTLDATLEGSLLDGPDQGYLYFQVPAGDYLASFDDDYGHSLTIRIVAQ